MPKTVDIYAGFHLHAAQQEVWDAFIDPDVRFLVIAFGRRGGKTELDKLMLAYTALQGKRAGYMAPTNKMMTQMWEELKTLLAPAVISKNETEHRLDLAGRGVIELWSLDNPDGPRGRSYDLVVLDETAILPSSRIFDAVVRPTLSDRRGKAVFTSTPRGLNWFYRFWLRGFDPVQYPRWRSFQYPTSANPYIDPAEIEEARRSLPSRIFREEYLAEFLGGDDAIFRITDDLVGGRWQSERQPGHIYVAGIDLARSQDFSVAQVLDITDPGRLEHVHQDRSQAIEFELQIGRICALHERFNFLTILIEDNAAGRPVFERMELLGLPVVPFRTTNLSKTMIINALSLRFERREIRLLDDPVLLGELRAYEATRLPSGLIRYSAPKDSHDDTVVALALANHAAEGWTVGQASFMRWG